MQKTCLRLITCLFLCVSSLLSQVQAAQNDPVVSVEKILAGDPKAVATLQSQAQQGHAAAQQLLGVMYAGGKGVPKNLPEAVKWYRKAADQGYAPGQNALGMMYHHGQGLPKDPGLAIQWLTKAAEQGLAEAQANLGRIYKPSAPQVAMQWFAKAAEQGDASAQVSLGFGYALGQGVPKDPVKAYTWLTVVKASAPPTSSEANAAAGGLEAIATVIPAQDIARAQQVAAAWLAAHPKKP